MAKRVISVRIKTVLIVISLIFIRGQYALPMLPYHEEVGASEESLLVTEEDYSKSNEEYLIKIFDTPSKVQKMTVGDDNLGPAYELASAPGAPDASPSTQTVQMTKSKVGRSISLHSGPYFDTNRQIYDVVFYIILSLAIGALLVGIMIAISYLFDYLCAGLRPTAAAHDMLDIDITGRVKKLFRKQVLSQEISDVVVYRNIVEEN